MNDNKYLKPCALITMGLILGAIFISLWLGQAPTPLDADAPATEFSAVRAMEYIEVMAQEPHPASSAANDAVFDYIVEQVQRLGLEMEIIHAPEPRRGNSVNWRRAVLGRLRGTNPTKAFAVDAHFDSVPYGPGAADDISGIAAMLETARALQAGPPLQNDIIFVFADQEEIGGGGADAFVDHPWFQEVGVMLGLEARGVSGPSLMFETSQENGWLIRELKRSGVSARANSIMFSVYDRLPFGSDFGAYKPHVPGYNIAYVDQFGYYHISLDRPDKVSLASVQHHGEYILGLAQHLGNIPLDNCRAPNATYFNVLGSWMVVYPQSWDTAFTVIALALLLIALVFSVVRGTVRIPGFFGALLATILCIALSMSVFILSLLVLIVYREAALYQNTLYALGLTLIGVAGCLLVMGLVRRILRGEELAAAALCLGTLLLYPLQKYLAGGAHIALLTLIIGSVHLILLALFKKQEQEHSPALITALTLWTLPLLTVMAPLQHMMTYTMTSMGTALTNAFVALILCLLAPQLFLVLGLGRWRMVAVTAVLGVTLFGWGFVANRPGPDTPKLNCLSYVADFDSGEAYWVSADRTTREWFRDIFKRELPRGWFENEKPTDSWTEQFFPEGTTRGAIPEFRHGDQREYLKAPAPQPNFARFSMTIIKDEIVGERRKVTMRIRSPRMAQRISVSKRFEGPIYAAQLDGIDLDTADDKWDLGLRCMPEPGAELTLEVAPEAMLKFFVHEESNAYPKFEQYTERPEHMAAEPNRVIDHHGRLHSEHTYTICTVEPKPEVALTAF